MKVDPRKIKILGVDDDPASLEVLKTILQAHGYQVLTAGSGKEGLAIVHALPVDLVITDLRMPVMDGLAFLKAIHSSFPSLSVIITSAYASIDSAVEAIKMGAYAYLTKPITSERVLHLVGRAIDEQQLRQENLYLRRQLEERHQFDNILGKSPHMQEIFRLIEDLEGSDATVLIQGNTGTGKELIARALHFHSPRKERPFLAVNCGGLTETLLESELFGHIKGAFTGATANKRGLFREADCGTLFLDEISETSAGMQVRLLRATQEGEIKPVGVEQPLRVDVRIIAATNQDLAQAMAAGRFRPDLYYRLNVIGIHLPDLRERREDIPPLAEHFLERYRKRLKKKELREISPEALAVLLDYEWPGNVRELENCIERAVVLTRGEAIGPEHLPGSLRHLTPERSITFAVGTSLEVMERQALLATLREVKGNKAAAARLLGISQRTLYRKIKTYGLDRLLQDIMSRTE
ncbi:MAG: sigma-54-dependent Fis family transcriptional regulator [candidate division NC10 bacterium]|nr:sigma-54-dependent Fis family transcriptional regulator [candidate division NC10 bacterium]